MITKFVVANSPEQTPEPTEVLTLHLQQRGNDFDIMLTLPSGQAVPLVGVRPGGKLSVVRWKNGCKELDRLVNLDSDGRIADLFGGR